MRRRTEKEREKENERMDEIERLEQGKAKLESCGELEEEHLVGVIDFRFIMKKNCSLCHLFFTFCLVFRLVYVQIFLVSRTILFTHTLTIFLPDITTTTIYLIIIIN